MAEADVSVSDAAFPCSAVCILKHILSPQTSLVFLAQGRQRPCMLLSSS